MKQRFYVCDQYHRDVTQGLAMPNVMYCTVAHSTNNNVVGRTYYSQ